MHRCMPTSIFSKSYMFSWTHNTRSHLRQTKAGKFGHSKPMFSLHSDYKHVDNNSPGLMLSLITVSLLKQVFLFLQVPPTHKIGGDWWSWEKQGKRMERKTIQGYVRETYLYLASHWYFPLLGNKCNLSDLVNNSFYAFLHCMKKAAPVMASSSHPCDLTAFRSMGLTQIPLWRCRTISVGNSWVLLEGKKVSISISLCHLCKLIPVMLCALRCLVPDPLSLFFGVSLVCLIMQPLVA